MLLISDNLQITNQAVEQAIKDGSERTIQEFVVRCLDAGCEALDINSGPLLNHPEQAMSFLVESVQAVTDVPLMIDTTNPIAMEAGLRKSKNHTIINGFSLQPSKLEKILPLAKQYEADIIGYLLHPDGHVPRTIDERLNIAVELFHALERVGVDPNRLIIDPIVAPLCWENGLGQNRDLLTIVKTLPELLGYPVKTIAGLSNLTTGDGPKQKKRSMERCFLSMLAASGLSMILFNVFHAQTVRIARACNTLTQEEIFAWDNF